MSGLPTQRERSDGASALVVIVRSVNVALELAFDPFAIAPAFRAQQGTRRRDRDAPDDSRAGVGRRGTPPDYA